MRSSTGQLMNHLPAIYQASDDLRVLLSIFEAVLLGPEDKDRDKEGKGVSHDRTKGLAEIITGISLLFDPAGTPREFVPWLSRWVALSDAGGLSLERQRRLLARIVPLYAKRGTREYLEELLRFHTPEGSIIKISEEGPAGFRIGEASVGIDTQLGGDRPYWFSVHIRIVRPDEEPGGRHGRLEQRIRHVIDLAKPAHTLYELQCEYD
jgi:phage tail-like protein